MPERPIAGSHSRALARLDAARLPGERRDTSLTTALGSLVPGWNGAERDDPDGVVTAVRVMAAQGARHAPWPDGIAPEVRSAMAERGVAEPYTHQAEAMAHAMAGRHVAVTTPTASGKTLCYNAPVLSAVVTDPGARALYLFPTKALAQDQLAELDHLSQALNASTGVDLGVFTYDGDTPEDARRAIRARARVVLTNPDMLHSGILPHHPKWAKLFENLRYVVIDELHTYRGVFGSHLTNVLRRLRRVAAHYGSAPVYICSSATIANPKELAEALTEMPVEVVAESGAPRGEKAFVFVNPPVVNRQLGIRRSYLAESRRVAIEFLRRGLQLILFAQSRLATELLTRYLKDAIDTAPGAADVVRGYRGGYLPQRRREIEQGMRDGDLRAVVTTNALELGIDIGALDVAVLASYPGTIAATWQRAGRAGRRSSRSAAVLVASSAPLDQFIVRHPGWFFGRSPEHALVNPDNLHVLVAHVKCAAFELPFGATERFGLEDVQQILAMLADAGFVHLAGEGDRARWHWTNESYPADAVSLRSISSDNFVVVDTTAGTRVIGETDFTSGPSTLHEKAIYIVEGTLFQVERLDFDGRKAYVRQVDCDYYTDAIRYDKVTVIDTFDEAEGPEGTIGRAGLAHGEVHVVSRVVGFKKIKFYTNENVGSGELDLPEQQMHTTAYWLTVPRAVMTALPFARDDRRDGVVGLSFAMGQVAQLLLMSDRHDIGMSVGSGHAAVNAGRAGGAAGADLGIDFDEPRVFVYDNYPGGIGFSEPLYRMHDMLLGQTRELVASCPCESGCPSCVGPLGQVGPMAKIVALAILDAVMAPRE